MAIHILNIYYVLVHILFPIVQKRVNHPINNNMFAPFAAGSATPAVESLIALNNIIAYTLF